MAKRRASRSARSARPHRSTSSAASPTAGWRSSTSEGNRVHITPSQGRRLAALLPRPGPAPRRRGLPTRLALTSALVGEGVTYVTRSLAAVIAYDTEPSVVIVDLNWRRPTPTSRRRHVPLGLADAVEDGVPLDDIILPTSNPRLSLVPAGAVAVARRPALAGSTALATVLDELEERFDHLLLDLPPVLASSEAMNLSQLADSYVLVVRQGATSEARSRRRSRRCRAARRSASSSTASTATSRSGCADSSAPDRSATDEAAARSSCSARSCSLCGRTTAAASTAGVAAR